MGNGGTTEGSRFAALDGWRGVCALAVASAHFLPNSHLLVLQGHSHYFVDYFFVLSGFVLSHAYRDKLGERGAPLWFMIRRFGRLWPLHAFVLALLVAAQFVKLLLVSRGYHSSTPVFANHTGAFAIVSHLFLVQGLGVFDYLTWNGPSWSISTEFWTNAVFALVCAVTLRGRPASSRCPEIAAVVVALAAGATLFAVSSEGMHATADFGMLRCLYLYFAGQLTYAIFRSGAFARWTGATLEVVAFAITGLFIALAMDRTIAFLSPLIFSFAVWAFAFAKGPVSRLLASRGFQALGRWSYSIYLTHSFFAGAALAGMTWLARGPAHGFVSLLPFDGVPERVIVFPNMWMADALMAAYLAVVVAVSALTWRWIEEPARRYFNHLSWQAASLPQSKLI